MRDTLIGIEQYGDGVVSEIIRPAAIVPEDAARQILATLQAQALDKGGCWVATPRQWCRYQTSGLDSLRRPIGELIGCIEAVYGATTRYEVTLYRVTVTPYGTEVGWTVESLCDEPLSYGGLTLATCPRAKMQPPPKPFRALRSIPDM